MWTNDSRMFLEPWVSFTSSNEEVVLFDEEREEVYGVDGPAAGAFVLLEQGRTFGEATDALLAELDVERAVLERDLSTVLDDLASLRVLRRLEGAGAAQKL